ncbi:MAG: hypothetical protein AABX99_03595 [Nanoarchaeota archaeon]
MENRLSDRLMEGRVKHPIYSLLGLGWTIAGIATEYKVITEKSEDIALNIGMIAIGTCLTTDGLLSIISGYSHEGFVRATRGVVRGIENIIYKVKGVKK